MENLTPHSPVITQEGVTKLTKTSSPLSPRGLRTSPRTLEPAARVVLRDLGNNKNGNTSPMNGNATKSIEASPAKKVSLASPPRMKKSSPEKHDVVQLQRAFVEEVSYEASATQNESLNTSVDLCADQHSIGSYLSANSTSSLSFQSDSPNADLKHGSSVAAVEESTSDVAVEEPKLNEKGEESFSSEAAPSVKSEMKSTSSLDDSLVNHFNKLSLDSPSLSKPSRDHQLNIKSVFKLGTYPVVQPENVPNDAGNDSVFDESFNDCTETFELLKKELLNQPSGSSLEDLGALDVALTLDENTNVTTKCQTIEVNTDELSMENLPVARKEGNSTLSQSSDQCDKSFAIKEDVAEIDVPIKSEKDDHDFKSFVPATSLESNNSDLNSSEEMKIKNEEAEISEDSDLMAENSKIFNASILENMKRKICNSDVEIPEAVKPKAENSDINKSSLHDSEKSVHSDLEIFQSSELPMSTEMSDSSPHNINNPDIFVNSNEEILQSSESEVDSVISELSPPKSNNSEIPEISDIPLNSSFGIQQDPEQEVIPETSPPKSNNSEIPEISDIPVDSSLKVQQDSEQEAFPEISETTKSNNSEIPKISNVDNHKDSSFKIMDSDTPVNSHEDNLQSSVSEVNSIISELSPPQPNNSDVSVNSSVDSRQDSGSEVIPEISETSPPKPNDSEIPVQLEIVKDLESEVSSNVVELLPPFPNNSDNLVNSEIVQDSKQEIISEAFEVSPPQHNNFEILVNASVKILQDSESTTLKAMNSDILINSGIEILQSSELEVNSVISELSPPQPNNSDVSVNSSVDARHDSGREVIPEISETSPPKPNDSEIPVQLEIVKDLESEVSSNVVELLPPFPDNSDNLVNSEIVQDSKQEIISEVFEVSPPQHNNFEILVNSSVKILQDSESTTLKAMNSDILINSGIEILQSSELEVNSVISELSPPQPNNSDVSVNSSVDTQHDSGREVIPEISETSPPKPNDSEIPLNSSVDALENFKKSTIKIKNSENSEINQLSPPKSNNPETLVLSTVEILQPSSEIPELQSHKSNNIVISSNSDFETLKVSVPEMSALSPLKSKISEVTEIEICNKNPEMTKHEDPLHNSSIISTLNNITEKTENVNVEVLQDPEFVKSSEIIEIIPSDLKSCENELDNTKIFESLELKNFVQLTHADTKNVKASEGINPDLLKSNEWCKPQVTSAVFAEHKSAEFGIHEAIQSKPAHADIVKELKPQIENVKIIQAHEVSEDIVPKIKKPDTLNSLTSKIAEDINICLTQTGKIPEVTKPVKSVTVSPPQEKIENILTNNEVPRNLKTDSSFSELFNLCKQQENELNLNRNEEEISDMQKPIFVSDDTKEKEEEDLGAMLAAEANMVSQDFLNASLEISEDKEDDIKFAVPANVGDKSNVTKSMPKTVFKSNNSSKETLLEAKSSNPVTLPPRNHNVITNHVLLTLPENMGDSVNFTRPMPSMDRGNMMDHNKFESNSNTMQNDVFEMPEAFQDAASFDFLANFGGRGMPSCSRLERESLYVKFDPLVNVADRKFYPSPKVELLKGRETSKHQHQPLPPVPVPNFTPPKSAVGTLIMLNTPKGPEAEVADIEEVQQPSFVSTPKSHVNDEPTAQQVAFTQELLERQEVVFNERISQAELETQKARREVDTMEKIIAKLTKQLNVKKNTEEQMNEVMKEYEDTISRLVTQKEHIEGTLKKNIEVIIVERDQAQTDLAGAELAFSDLHRKYERAKTAIEGFRSNEEALKSSLKSHQDTIKHHEEKYLRLKEHAEKQLEIANVEIETLARAKEMEVASMSAQLRQAQTKVRSLEESLENSKRENQELVTICDDLVARMGRP